MKITYVNNTDLPGRIFNGYDMMNTLNSMGYDCNQIVIDKVSDNKCVEPLLSKKELYVKSLIKAYEMETGSINLMMPFSEKIINHSLVQNADIIHYHILHNNMISIYDLNNIIKFKTCVWTLHDPWIFTGHCVHPLDCDKWKTGCINCERKLDEAFPLFHNTAHQLWEIKKKQLCDIDIHIIVSTDFMIDYIKQSPITSHFSKIHKIPFGIDLNKIKCYEKEYAKNKLNICKDDYVIAIRDEKNPIKGVEYFINAVSYMPTDKITILSVGNGDMLSVLSEKYNCIKLGWSNNAETMDLFYSAADVFVMPSLAESFGLMAVESMAHETPVVCFNNTVIPEIIHQEECGMMADYKNSESLFKSIEWLKLNKEARLSKGKNGRKVVEKYYRYEDYINKHIELYNNILYR